MKQIAIALDGKFVMGEGSPKPAVPIVWSVAGSDSGAGAGLPADMRAIDAFGVHGCTVVAAITAQKSLSVQRIEAVGVATLEAQLAALAGDMPPAAIKTGMLGSAENLQVLVQYIDRLRQRRPALLVVVDPVLRASTGAVFADEALLHGYRTALLPRATLMTPNRSEAAALPGCAPLRSRHDRHRGQPLRAAPLPHHPACGSAPGGSRS